MLRTALVGLGLTVLLGGLVCAQCVDPINSDVAQLNLGTDGTLMASSIGSHYDGNTNYVDGADGNQGGVPGQYRVGNLMDGVTGTGTFDYWFRGGATSATLVVKFPTRRVINKIILDKHELAGHANNANYTVQSSADTSNGFDGSWTTLPSAAASGAIVHDQVIDIDLTMPVSTRYLRILLTRTSGSALSLNEITVFEGDNLGDACDSCPTVAGDLIDGCPSPLDSDNDGIPDTSDNCPGVQNTAQSDGDGDGVGDACDNCPATANADQLNSDVTQYDLTTDGTLVASSVGGHYDSNTGYVDSSDGDQGGVPGQYRVGNLIDGDKGENTYDYWYRGGASSATLTFQFPAPRVVSRVVLDNHTVHDGSESYVVEWSNDSSTGFDGTWSTLPSAAASGYITRDQVIDIPLTTPVQTRFMRVRVVRTSSWYAIQLNEVEVYGGDLLGDVCDSCSGDGGDLANGCASPPDYDGDGVADSSDNCPLVPNGDQAEGDGDGLGDACDNCPTVANLDQLNSDVAQYDLTNDGTLVASSVGGHYDGNTGYVDSADGNQGGVAGQYRVGNLIDGDKGENTYDYWYLGGASSATLTFQFPVPRVISRVVLDNHTVHDGSESYVVEWSADSSTGFDGTWSALPSPAASGHITRDQVVDIPLTAPIQTRFMRVRVVRGGSWYAIQLNEVEVYGGDLLGDACDSCVGVGGNLPDGCATPPDYDGDGVPDAGDNCLTTPNSDQLDTDADGVGDACDNCPTTANAGQQNSDITPYDLSTDGTLVASSAGYHGNNGFTGFVGPNTGAAAGDQYQPGNLIDGDTGENTLHYWFNGSAGSSILTLKFPAPRVVYKIVLDNHSVHDSSMSYVVETSTDTTTGFDGTWTSVSGPAASGTVSTDQVIEVQLAAPVYMAYLRVRVTVLGSWYDVMLNEIIVFGGDALGDACDLCPTEGGLQANGCNNLPPTAACQDITVAVGPAGTVTVAGEDLDGGSTDPDLPGDTLTFTPSPATFSCADLGANTVTLTVADSFAESDTCTATVTVTSAGTCAELTAAVHNALCNVVPVPTNYEDLLALIDSTIATFVGASTICDPGSLTLDQCRTQILLDLGLTP